MLGLRGRPKDMTRFILPESTVSVPGVAFSFSFRSEEGLWGGVFLGRSGCLSAYLFNNASGLLRLKSFFVYAR